MNRPRLRMGEGGRISEGGEQDNYRVSERAVSSRFEQ